MPGPVEDDSPTLLATARCDSCGIVAELRASTVAVVDDLFQRFKQVFLACPKCEGNLEFRKEVA